MIWLLFIALVTPVSSANSEYYHEFSKKIFNVTSGHNSYFGYSIAYEPQSKTLIVSAPISNIAGDVYLCDIANGSCDTVKTDVSSECTGNKIYGKENMWLGAVVKSGPSYYVTCAPRCIKPDLRFRQSTTEGRCFIGFNKTMSPEHLKSIPDKYRYEGNRKLEETMLSFGWSLDVFENKSIAIGGPAMVSGRLERYSRFDASPGFINGDVRGVNFNFGYSVATGYFIRDQGISYAVGSPYGTRGYGKVVLLSSNLNNQGALTKDDSMYKKDSMYQLGAMYGSVLCTVSFTGKMTDLLVGAPTYATEYRRNIGAVYVYVRGRSNMPVYQRTIIGEHDNSYFGSAIVSIGDLNNDQMDEVAIAAPYEADGRGAVYLYSGADILRIGRPFRPLQKILPQDGWRTFGLALSSLQDYDDNGCNELAIGAPESDKVLLLRCMASVHVEVYIEVPPLKNDKLNSVRKSFVFKSCLKVRYPEKPKIISAMIEMKAEIIHQNAKLKDPKEATYNVSLDSKKDHYCKKVEVLTPENGNYDVEIGIHVSASHIDNPIKQRKFASSHVVLTDNSVLEKDRNVRAAECNNHRCMPDLVYTETKFSIDDKLRRQYVIGSSPTISATIGVINQGEQAYDACVHVHVHGARVLSAPAGCELAADRPRYSWLICSPKQVLWTRIKWSTNPIIIDTTLLTNLDENIEIKGDIFNHCRDTSEKNKTFTEIIHLVSDTSGVTVRGLTDFGGGNYVNMTKSDIAIGKKFEHVYEVSNNGPTTWVNIDFQVRVKQLPIIEIYDVTINDPFQINDFESTCKNIEIEPNEISLLKYNCKIEKLSKYPIVVLLPMRVKPGAVGDTIDKDKTMTVHSELTFVLHGEKKFASVTSTLKKSESFVPLWVILSTAFLGLVILTVIGLILRELGLLERKNKDKLERVRQSVRRQTIMRRQTRTERSEKERVNSQEMQAMLAEAAKMKHDRRVRVPSSD